MENTDAKENVAKWKRPYLAGNSLISSWVHFHKSTPHSFRFEAIIYYVYSSPHEQGMLIGRALHECVNSVSGLCVYYPAFHTNTPSEIYDWI